MKKIKIFLLTLILLFSFGSISYATEMEEGSNQIEEESTQTVELEAYKGSTYSVVLPKTIVVDATTGSANYGISVKGDLNPNDNITITSDETLVLSSEYNNTDTVELNVNRNKTTWTWEDVQNNNESVVTETLSLNDGNSISAGDYRGVLTFYISCKSICDAHTYGEYEILDEGSCIAPMVLGVTCSNCGHKETMELPNEENHINVINGICQDCGLNNIPGLYDVDGNMIVSWRESTIDKRDCKNAKDVINTQYQNAVKVIIADTVTSIYPAAFWTCENIEEVIIPNSVTEIGGSAFSECTSLKKIDIPESVTIIENAVFNNCTSLETVEIPSEITVVSNSLFMECTSLKEVTFKGTVTEIQHWVFAYCTSLEKIYYNGTTTEWNNISFGSDWNLDISENYQVVCTNGTL